MDATKNSNMAGQSGTPQQGSNITDQGAVYSNAPGPVGLTSEPHSGKSSQIHTPYNICPEVEISNLGMPDIKIEAVSDFNPTMSIPDFCATGPSHLLGVDNLQSYGSIMAQPSSPAGSCVGLPMVDQGFSTTLAGGCPDGRLSLFPMMAAQPNLLEADFANHHLQAPPLFSDGQHIAYTAPMAAGNAASDSLLTPPPDSTASQPVGDFSYPGPIWGNFPFSRYVT
jgi:hypothetical protein